MDINTIVNIDNNSKSEYKIKEENYKNKNYKSINISKNSIFENRNEFAKLCEGIRKEINSKGYSIFIYIDNYDEINNEWIYAVIAFMTYVIHVNYLEVSNYLKQKINFIKNISQIINNCLYDDYFDDIFNI